MDERDSAKAFSGRPTPKHTTSWSSKIHPDIGGQNRTPSIVDHLKAGLSAQRGYIGEIP